MRAQATHILLLILVGVMFSSGCKQSQEVGFVNDEPSAGRERDLALQHYIEGLMYDQKGEYAKAVLEYQDALRYDKDPAIYFALAKDYSLLGKHALAAQMGTEAVKLDPANRTYRETLAEIYLNAFEVDKAIAAYEDVVALDSSSIDGWYNLARLSQLRKPLKAIEIYEKILSRFGPTWDVYVQLLTLHTSLGRLDEATTVARTMLEIDPANYELRRTLADLYLQADRKDEALRVYRDLMERKPQDLEVRAAITHIYLIKQDYEKAKHQLESVLTSDTLSVETQLRFGQYFASFLQKDTVAAPYAFSIFEKIRENYPADWRPYWFLGIIANVMNDDSAVAGNLERVTFLAPQNPDGWVYYGSMYLERSDYQRALEIFERARVHLPDEPRIHFLLGWSYHRLKRNEDASHALERAVEQNSKDINAIGLLALVYDELKRYADSDRLYEDALKIDPQSHVVLNNYGYSLAERGEQLERALTMAKEAVRQEPKNASYLDTIGWVYFKLGDYEEAERFIRKAVELGDASAVVLEHLGDVYAKLGQKEKALEYWNKALERDETNTTLQSKITRGGL